MPWYLTDPKLKPLFVMDAAGVEAALLGNTYTNKSVVPVLGVTDVLSQHFVLRKVDGYRCFSGSYSRSHWVLPSKIILPTNCVIAAFFMAVDARDELLNTDRINNGPSLFANQDRAFYYRDTNYFLLFDRYGKIQCGNGDVSCNFLMQSPMLNTWKFLAIAKEGNTYRVYDNGNWCPISSAQVPVTIGSFDAPVSTLSTNIDSIGKELNGYNNLYPTDNVGALAIFEGVANLAQLKALELEVRAFLAGTDLYPKADSSTFWKYNLLSPNITATTGKPPNTLALVTLNSYISHTINLAGDEITLCILKNEFSWYGFFNFSVDGKKRFRVTIKNVPASRLVRLHDRNSGVVVAQKFSDTDGLVTFEHIDTGGKYYAIALDHECKFNAVVSDLP